MCKNTETIKSSIVDYENNSYIYIRQNFTGTWYC